MLYILISYMYYSFIIKTITVLKTLKIRLLVNLTNFLPVSISNQENFIKDHLNLGQFKTFSPLILS